MIKTRELIFVPCDCGRESPPWGRSPVMTKINDGGPDATALFTHHHYGWRKHDLPNSHPDHLTTALLDTHGFLRDYEGKYRVEIERTPACSYDGRVSVFWNHKDSKTDHVGAPLRQGDHWFFAFEFNVARNDACRHCGGTGMDHYAGPFFHCWACDGTGACAPASPTAGGGDAEW